MNKLSTQKSYCVAPKRRTNKRWPSASRLLFRRFFIVCALALVITEASAVDPKKGEPRAPFCTDFNKDTTVSPNWEVNYNGANQTRPGVTKALGSPGQGGPSDKYLEVTDESNTSVIWNKIDYGGDWTGLYGKCLCFDIQLKKVEADTSGVVPTPHPYIGIFQGSDPLSAPLCATFSANITISMTSGWAHICVPLGPLDGSGNPPSNSEGQWRWRANNGVPQGTNADWPTLMGNVSGIWFSPDLTKVPSEIYYYDNICIKDCPGHEITPTPTVTPTPTASGCAQVTGEPRCQPDGSYSYTFNVTNNSGNAMSQILLTPAAGSTFTLSPQLTNLSTPLQNGQSTTVTTTIGNVKPGDKVCFFVSLMSDNAKCCIVQVCPILPRCGEVSPTPFPGYGSPPQAYKNAPQAPRQQSRGRRRP